MTAAVSTGPVALVLSKLEGVHGNGHGFMARCPAHDDRKGSLSIGEGIDGEALVYCFAGCRTQDVVSTIGIEMKDLFPRREEPAPRAPSRTPGKITRYEIRDTSGKLIAIHGREDHAAGKGLWWELPDGTRGLGGKKTADVPLFGIDRLPATGAAIIVEGEKAAAALMGSGIPAVGTITGASGTPGDEALRPLLGRPVLLWPDNDDPGRQHMGRIFDSLVRLGHRDIRFIDWKGAPPKGDAADLVSLEAWRDEFDVLLEEAKLPEGVQIPKPLLHPVDELLKNPRRPVWAVDGLIERPSLGETFGTTGSGKSLTLTDLLCNAATEGEWMGRKVTIPGPLVYFNGEGHTGILRRFAAWEIHHGKKIPPGRVFISDRAVEFDETGGKLALEEIHRIAKVAGTNPGLIGVDTLARHLAGNENDPEDMGNFLKWMDRLKEEFGCAVMVVHHSGHQNTERSRAHSCNKAALDVEFRVSKSGTSRTIEVTKARDLPDETRLQEFTLKPVVIEATEEGEIITSVAVSWDGIPSRPKARKLTRTEQLGLDTLAKVIEEGGGLRASLESWRFLFYRQHWADTTAAKKTAFLRTRATLIAKEAIQVEDDRYSIQRR